MRALRPFAVILKVVAASAPVDSTARTPPRGIAWEATTSMFSAQLDPVLRQQDAGHVPGELYLVVLDEAAGDAFGIAGVDLGAGRTRRPEREAAELQASRGGAGTLLDEVEGEGLGFLVLGFLQNLEAIDDRPGRADQVVADPRAQQGGEVEGFEGGGGGHLILRSRVYLPAQLTGHGAGKGRV